MYSDEFDSQKRELESALLQMSKLSGTISTQLQELSRLREVSRAAQLIGTKLKKFPYSLIFKYNERINKAIAAIFTADS